MSIEFDSINFISFHCLDIQDLHLPRNCSMVNEGDDLLNFKIIISPDEVSWWWEPNYQKTIMTHHLIVSLQGFYKNGRFTFNFKVSQNYPHEPPKVKCETKVYHPNIDLEGNVCLNILREDWKPVLTINSIVYGLQYLFLVSFDQWSMINDQW